MSVFFDLEKAYDTTWKYGILKDVYSMGFRGRMLQFIDSLLKSRQSRFVLGPPSPILLIRRWVSHKVQYYLYHIFVLNLIVLLKF